MNRHTALAISIIASLVCVLGQATARAADSSISGTISDIDIKKKSIRVVKGKDEPKDIMVGFGVKILLDGKEAEFKDLRINDRVTMIYDNVSNVASPRHAVRAKKGAGRIAPDKAKRDDEKTLEKAIADKPASEINASNPDANLTMDEHAFLREFVYLLTHKYAMFESQGYGTITASLRSPYYNKLMIRKVPGPPPGVRVKVARNPLLRGMYAERSQNITPKSWDLFTPEEKFKLLNYFKNSGRRNQARAWIKKHTVPMLGETFDEQSLETIPPETLTFYKEISPHIQDGGEWDSLPTKMKIKIHSFYSLHPRDKKDHEGQLKLYKGWKFMLEWAAAGTGGYLILREALKDSEQGAFNVEVLVYKNDEIVDQEELYYEDRRGFQIGFKTKRGRYLLTVPKGILNIYGGVPHDKRWGDRIDHDPWINVHIDKEWPYK